MFVAFVSVVLYFYHADVEVILNYFLSISMYSYIIYVFQFNEVAGKYEKLFL